MAYGGADYTCARSLCFNYRILIYTLWDKGKKRPLLTRDPVDDAKKLDSSRMSGTEYEVRLGVLGAKSANGAGVMSDLKLALSSFSAALAGGFGGVEGMEMTEHWGGVSAHVKRGGDGHSKLPAAP